MNIRNIRIFNKNADFQAESPKKTKENQQDTASDKTVNFNQSPNCYYSEMEIKGIKPIQSQSYPKHLLKNYTGCLIGGSIGDALGWPVEFRVNFNFCLCCISIP